MRPFVPRTNEDGVTTIGWNNRVSPVRSSPSPPKTPIAMASACQAPPRPQSSVTVPAGCDASKKGALPGPHRPPPDVDMNDAEAEASTRQPAPEASTPTFKPSNTLSEMSCFITSMLGPAALSKTHPGFVPEPLLVQLALVRKLEGIHATILSVKATADHAQQVASAALNMASAATSAATRSYAQTAAAPPPKAHPTRNRPAAQPLAAQDPKPTGTRTKAHLPLLLPLPAPEAKNLLPVLRTPRPKARPPRQPIHRPSADSSLP